MIRALVVNLRRLVARNVDLVGLWLVLLGAQFRIPVDHYVGRDDLMPWMCVALSVIAVFRGRKLGAGPHPMLTERSTAFGDACQRAAMAVVPWTVLALHDLARYRTVFHLGILAGSVVLLVVAMSLAGEQGRTAWNPPPHRGCFAWVAGVLFFATVATLAALVPQLAPTSTFLSAGATATILGLGFLGVGLVSGRARNHRQRVIAGRKDGRPYRAMIFPSFLAFLGPSVALMVLWVVLPTLNFDFAFVVALLVVVWGGIIWPAREPVAVGCILHEVVPVGGAEVAKGDTARPFHRPPQGAMRFNPLRVERTRNMQPWLVPVKSPRIADLDDPVRPLWPVPLLPRGHHVLGDAAFEPDPLTKGAQWETITIRLGSNADAEVQDEEAGGSRTQRIVVLRAFPGMGGGRRPRTYQWDASVPRDSVQVLDSTTESLSLKNGDIIVISSEGVPAAYEVEVGAPLYADSALFRARPPQIQDYVKL